MAYQDVANHNAPPKEHIIAALSECDKQCRELAEAREKLRQKMCDLYAPFKKGDKVVIRLRKDGKQHFAKIKAVYWDSLACDFMYMFKTRMKGKRRIIPSGHTVDCVIIA